MRRLILFRHAKAEPRGPGEDDFDRPLSERGREDAALIGKALAAEGFAPDCALISPARRTAETWICARDDFPRIRAELNRALYNAGAEDIREVIDAAAERCDTLIVIGHNPGMHELAVELLMDASASAAEIEQVAARFPTSTAAVYAIDEVGRARLDRLLLARDLGGEGDG
ncbi:MAG TPA: histidine phosphatase family protein [Caulobacteraceae bacterium]|jgi:phosphohistidine phosphatase